MSKKSIFVLGSASWLGSLFLSKISDTKYEIISTYNNTYLKFDKAIDLQEAKLITNYRKYLDSIQPEIIINYLRNDNYEELKIHEEIIQYCENNLTCNYVFCSSALALDGYKNQELVENLLANSISIYGIFKSKCERMLYESKIDWTILRFASLQGYCKHKIIRNEYLLKQLKNGETVKVDQKVFQNRMYAEDAVDIVIKIIDSKLTGIIHLGTCDASDEVDFLRNQAVLYGYKSSRIQSKEYIRDVNLNCVPSKIYDLDKKYINLTEAYTLKKIYNIKAYEKYKNTTIDA